MMLNELRILCEFSTANLLKESHNLPSNTFTESEIDHLRHEFSGSMLATQPVSSKVVGKLRTESRSPIRRISRLTYLNLFMIDYMMKRRESGFSSSTMSMMIISFMKLHSQVRMCREAAKMACQGSHSWHIFLQARMTQFL